ncbi:MAG TPA: GNAT family N-acetyltransferase [Holophagaceae bacterium]|nr:GNAT family N-acetyltransferase [Holophagaceae bacterium]
MFEELPWDTACFGFKVAVWKGPPTALGGASIPSALRAAGVRLLYVFTEATGPDVELKTAGAVWVDDKVLFAKAGLAERPPWEALPAPVGDPGEGLRSLAFESGRHSRFRTDPRMPEACFRALYEAWIVRSCRREIADEVLISGPVADPEGMVTVQAEQAVARIGLIAVRPDAQGRGLGRGLVFAAEAWAKARGLDRMEVATQGANVAACALYARCGYEVVRRQGVYHLWIDSEAPWQT